MKPLEVALSTNSDDPEIVVDDISLSMMDPIESRGDPPEPTLSLSPKSSRSGKDGKKHRSRSKRRGESGHASPSSPKNTRSPPRSPRMLEIHSDLSREPPEQMGGSEDPEVISDAKLFFPSTKRAEPPDQTIDISTIPYLAKAEFATKVGAEPVAEKVEKVIAPLDFKLAKSAKSMKSSKSVAGSRRSRSRSRKAQKVAAEVPESTHFLHGVFSGHLMKWRFEAEEGGPFVRIPAFLGSTSLVMTTTYALIFDPNTWTILSIVLALFIYAIALLGLILEGRFMCSNPLGIRAHLRSALTRRNRVFRFVWGRGLLYVVAGLLSCGLLLIPTIIPGIFMVAVGLIAVVSGGYASRMFYLLRDSLKDDDYLATAFNRYDSDGDGFITLPEFVSLLSKLGMDLDDRIGIKAFHAADVNHEYKISLEAFQTWWRGAFLKNGNTQKLEDLGSDLGTDEEEGSYHRMG